ncbi:hypothetical protein GCM10010347_43730 [Streptomyces cirratus]|uniref:Uncharacterized protein n=1 Tax=Streptomyces cirratus TaxID=68187 RepID=A0ABQ3F316_9ACTN|nr:hypothetical protein [Streptomyces cirratus]GHB68727.1 hypothetical protein GCM10010347_43730 [Streptomyces cirratus]
MRHEEVLLRSPFSRIEAIHWDRTDGLTVDEVVGLQLSFSFTSPAALGSDKMLRDLEPARTDERQYALGRTADRARTRGKEVRNGRTGQHGMLMG